MLELRNVTLICQGTDLIKDACLTVARGEIIALTGPSGTGKSALIAALAGLAHVPKGRVFWEGRDITHTPLHGRDGIALVPEGRQLARSLTVAETLRLGAGRMERRALQARLQDAFAQFPVLAQRRSQAAGTLSGGEAQMLSLARALMAAPRLLLLDEPTQGLSPAAAKAMFRTLATLGAQGLSMVLTDQDAAATCRLADRVFALSNQRLDPVAHPPRTTTTTTKEPPQCCAPASP